MQMQMQIQNEMTLRNLHLKDLNRSAWKSSAHKNLCKRIEDVFFSFITQLLDIQFESDVAVKLRDLQTASLVNCGNWIGTFCTDWILVFIPNET